MDADRDTHVTRLFLRVDGLLKSAPCAMATAGGYRAPRLSDAERRTACLASPSTDSTILNT